MNEAFELQPKTAYNSAIIANNEETCIDRAVIAKNEEPYFWRCSLELQREGELGFDL